MAYEASRAHRAKAPDCSAGNRSSNQSPYTASSMLINCRWSCRDVVERVGAQTVAYNITRSTSADGGVQHHQKRRRSSKGSGDGHRATASRCRASRWRLRCPGPQSSALWGPWQRRHCLPRLHWPDFACSRHTWHAPRRNAYIDVECIRAALGEVDVVDLDFKTGSSSPSTTPGLPPFRRQTCRRSEFDVWLSLKTASLSCLFFSEMNCR